MISGKYGIYARRWQTGVSVEIYSIHRLSVCDVQLRLGVIDDKMDLINCKLRRTIVLGSCV